MILAYVLVFLCALGLGPSKADPCSAAIDLGNPKRSVNYTLQGTDVSICDAYSVATGGWYSFFAYTGTDIPQLPVGQVVPPRHCGSLVPIWIQGTVNPIGSQILSAKVCGNYGGGCDWSATINMTSCAFPNGTQYHAYQLVTPLGCPGAYCAGQGMACSNGLVWNEALDTCVMGYPALTNIPYIAGPFIDTTTYSYSNTFNFTCNVVNTTKSADAKFKVTFLFDGAESFQAGKGSVQLDPLYLSWSDLPANLPSIYLRGRMGKWISCQMNTYWGSMGLGTMSPTYSSTINSAYWAGMKYVGNNINPISLTSSVPSASVSFVPTVPVFCPTDANPPSCASCSVIVALDSGLPGTDYCQYEVNNEDYSGIANEPKNVMQVTANQNNGQDVNYGLEFKPTPTSTFCKPHYPGGGSIWDGYVFPPIPVEVHTTAPRKCTAVTDPHVTGFDGRYCTYGDIGTFVLWRSTTQRNFEVQIQTWPWPSNNVGCICGVAVREGNQILGISMCQSASGQSSAAGDYFPIKTIQYLGEQGSGVPKGTISLISTTSSYSKYKIMMPSGANVEATVYDTSTIGYNYINVVANPIPQDYNNCEGLCGPWTGEMPAGCEDEETWGVTMENSFFASEQSCKSYQYSAPPLCGCDSNDKEISCSNDGIPSDVIANLGITCSNGNRKRRSSQSYSDNAVNASDIFNYTPYIKNPLPNPLWPTISGITEAQAETFCDQAMRNSSVYSTCSTSYNITGVVDTCKMDIAVSGDLAFLSDVVNIFDSRCQIAAQSSVVLTSVNQTEVQQQLDVVNSISNQVCPNQCSAHGNCSNGACVCQTGYTGSDCSLVEGLPPTLFALQNGGLCNRRQQPCQFIRIYATNIDSSPTATQLCKMVLINSGSLTYGSATVVSARELGCSLPSSPVWPSSPMAITYTNATYEISVTNDGVHYSDSVILTVFDSQCIACNTSGICFVKPNTCSIQGTCYLAGDFNDDSCFTCQPEINQASWTKSSSESCGTDSGTNDGVSLAAIICITIVTLVVIVGAVVVLVMYKFYSMTRAQKKGTNYSTNSVGCLQSQTPSNSNDPPPDYEDLHVDLEFRPYTQVDSSPYTVLKAPPPAFVRYQIHNPASQYAWSANR